MLFTSWSSTFVYNLYISHKQPNPTAAGSYLNANYLDYSNVEIETLIIIILKENLDLSRKLLFYM